MIEPCRGARSSSSDTDHTFNVEVAIDNHEYFIEKLLFSFTLQTIYQSPPSCWQDFRGELGVLWAYERHPAETGEHDAGRPGGGNPHSVPTDPSAAHLKHVQFVSRADLSCLPAHHHGRYDVRGQKERVKRGAQRTENSAVTSCCP